MSKLTKTPTELSGMLGERVSVRKVGARIVVTNRPQRRAGELSAKQVAHKERFQQAIHYAKQQLAQDESAALYAKGVNGTKRSAYLVAVSDHLIAPKVTSIDSSEYDGAAGSTIEIRAIDDFMVTGVKIVIIDGSGNVLEKGEATPTPTLYNWKYTATVANPSLQGTTIRAVATDRPGNKATLEIKL